MDVDGRARDPRAPAPSSALMRSTTEDEHTEFTAEMQQTPVVISCRSSPSSTTLPSGRHRAGPALIRRHGKETQANSERGAAVRAVQRAR